MADGKRVAKNTVFLYIRMLVVMGVTLFTSRVYLQALGVDGYGVWNLVGGLAASFGFFTSSLSNATQRFLSVGHGRNDIEEVRSVFNASAYIYVIFGGTILLIGMLLGPWLISLLNIPPALHTASYWVYYATIVGLSVSITATMFDSVLIARENMKIYAYLSVVEAFLKLAIAYLIMIAPSATRLIVFALLSALVVILVKGAMIVYCARHYEEVHIKPHWDKPKVRSMIGFIGWNGIGTAVYALNDQSTSVLLNVFFGPVVNAARGVANQVNSAINTFSTNFFTAFTPQLIKTYAAGERAEFAKLFVSSNTLSFALLWFLFLPLILRRDYVLGLWLEEVPGYTSVFLVWILLYSLVNSFTRPQWITVQAHGNLKPYMRWSISFTLVGIACYYGILKLGMPPQSIFIVMVIVRAMFVMVSWRIVKRYVELSTGQYLRRVYLPLAVLVCASFAIMYLIDPLISQTFGGLVAVCLISLAVNGPLFFYAVLSRGEREKIVRTIKQRFKR